MNTKAFKAYDIRGKYPDEINEDLAYSVGRALVRYLSAKTIVVGHDMRDSSPSLSLKMVEGINCEGADVIDIGLCTTPMLNFAVARYGYDGGVMISASHNPKGDNAFKLIRGGAMQIDADTGITDIKKIIEKGFGACGPQKGALTTKDVLADYLEHILSFSKEIGGQKIVVDYGNGVGAITATPALARLDLTVTSLYEDPDGNFPNHPANPHDINNFRDLISEVHTKGADLGIFFDGDADRAVFVDDLGRVVPTDLLFVLLAKEELSFDENKGKNYYYDLRFSKSVPDEIEKYGGKPVMMKVGNPTYKRALKEKGGVLAAEYSGHIMYAVNFNLDDGLFAVIKTLSLLSKEKRKLSEMIDEINIYKTSPEESMEAKNSDTVFERIISSYPEAKQIELDGVYLDFSDGFISVRQSQNEPELFRIRVEAKNKEELDSRVQKVTDIIKEG